MEKVIDDLEKADVQVNNRIVLLRLRLHERRRLRIKGLAIVDARKGIELDIMAHLDDLTVLGRLLQLAPLVLQPGHDIVHAAAHDGRVVRLRDEIRRAHLHSPHLTVALVASRRSDYRNLRKLLPLLENRKQLEPIHDRHSQVEQHDIHRLLLHDIQGFLAVGGLDDDIVIPEKLH